MAPNQPRLHLAIPRWVLLVFAFLGAQSGCGFASTAQNSVDAAAVNFNQPSVSRADAPAPAVATSVEQVSVPAPTPGEPVTAVMNFEPQRVSVGETVEVVVRIRIAGAHFIHARNDAGGPFIPVWYIDPLAKKRGSPTREMRGPKRASRPFPDVTAAK